MGFSVTADGTEVGDGMGASDVIDPDAVGVGIGVGAVPAVAVTASAVAVADVGAGASGGQGSEAFTEAGMACSAEGATGTGVEVGPWLAGVLIIGTVGVTGASVAGVEGTEEEVSGTADARAGPVSARG